MGQGRMVPNMNPSLSARGGSVPPGSRAMVNMQMMGSGAFHKWLLTSPCKNLAVMIATSIPRRNGSASPFLPSTAGSAQSDCTVARPDDD